MRDMSVNVFASSVSFPCGISPTAMQKMAHVDGEVATAKGEFYSKIFHITNSLSFSRRK